jgi:hypothetical protein
MNLWEKSQLRDVGFVRKVPIKKKANTSPKQKLHMQMLESLHLNTMESTCNHHFGVCNHDKLANLMYTTFLNQNTFNNNYVTLRKTWN